MSYRQDKHRKVEDSTKGASDINPRTYKRDQFVQVWMHSRYLATLLKWFDSEGVMIRFKSELMREAIEQIVDHLVDTKKVEMVDMAEDAMRMLENRFDSDRNPGGKGGKNIVHNLTLDNRRIEGAVGSYNPKSRFIKDEPCSSATSLQHDHSHSENRGDSSNSDRREETVEEMLIRGRETLRKKEREKVKEAARVQLEKIKADAVIDEDGTIHIPTVYGGSNGPVGEEEKRKFDEDEEERSRLRKEKEKEERLEKKKEALESEELVKERSEEEILEHRRRRDEEEKRKLEMM